MQPGQIDAQHGWMIPVGIAILGGPPSGGPIGPGIMATVHCVANSDVAGSTTVRLEGVSVAEPVWDRGMLDAMITFGKRIGAGGRPSAPAPRLVGPDAPVHWMNGVIPKSGSPGPTAASATEQASPAKTATPAIFPAPRPATEPAIVVSVPVTYDLAPSVPIQNKSEAVVLYPDGHEEGWLLSPSTDINTLYVRLPPGARILVVASPASIVGQLALPPVIPTGVATPAASGTGLPPALAPPGPPMLVQWCGGERRRQ
jgi:hypothetical protein